MFSALIYYSFFLLTAFTPVLTLGVPRISSVLPIITAVVAVVVLLIRERSAFHVSRMIGTAFLLFIVVFLDAATRSSDLHIGFERFAALVCYILVGFILLTAAGHLDKNHRTKAVKALIYSILATTIGLVIFALVPPETIMRWLHISHLSQSPEAWTNRAAVTITLFTAPVLGWMWKNRPWWQTLLLAIILGIGIFGSQSETAKLAFIIAVGIFSLSWLYFPAAFALSAVGLLGFIVSCPWLVIGLHNFAVSHFSMAWKSQTFLGRLSIWKEVAQRVFEAPWTGWGIEALRDVQLPITFIPGQVQNTVVNHPHNAVLQIWLEMGAVGAGAFTILIGTLLYVIFRIENRKGRAVALSGLVTAFSIAAVSHGAWQAWWLGLLATTVAVVTLVRDEPSHTA